MIKAHVAESPAPVPTKRTKSPRFTLFSRIAIVNAIGTDAATQFPYLETMFITFSLSNPPGDTYASTAFPMLDEE